MRTRIYLACPISKGDLLHNVRQASDAALALLRAGYAVLNPAVSVFTGTAHRDGILAGEVVAYAEVLPAGTIHRQWLDSCLSWVACADALLRLPGESVGADEEEALARTLGTPVYRDLLQLIAEIPPENGRAMAKLAKQVRRSERELEGGRYVTYATPDELRADILGDGKLCQSAPAGEEVADSAALLRDVYRLVDNLEVQLAVDLIFGRVDRMLCDGRFDEVDAVCASADVGRLLSPLVRSLLTITSLAREKLPSWPGLVRRGFARVKDLRGERAARSLLKPFLEGVDLA